jgi:hypothetical protein
MSVISITLTDDGPVVEARCDLDGTVAKRLIPALTPEMFMSWLNGELIQVAMAALSPDDREFFMTGITPEKWDDIFPTDDDEDDVDLDDNLDEDVPF